MRSNELPAYIIDASNNLVYISDIETDELVYANKATIKAFADVGITDWKGQKAYRDICGKNSHCENYSCCELKEGQSVEWEEYSEVLKKRFLIKAEIINYQGMICRVEIAKDITHATALEMELKSKLEEQKLLEDCVELLHSNLTPDESINKLLQYFGEYYQAERSAIFCVDQENTDKVGCAYEWCQEGVFPTIDIMQNMPKDFMFSFGALDEIKNFNSATMQQQLMEVLPEFKGIDDREDVMFITAPFDGDVNNKNFSGFISVYNPQVNINQNDAINALGKFVSDFLNRSELIETLNKLSYRDVLTGLKNHISYREKIEEYEVRKPQTLGVTYVDINGLKSINNKKGHIYGDKIIIKVAKILYELFGDSVYRVDGNEFIILEENVSEEGYETFMSELKKRINDDEQVDVSVGFSWNKISDVEGEHASVLGDSVSIYNDYEIKEYRNFLRNNLVREIKNGRFIVYYQPQINLERNEIVGAEALIRKLDSAGNVLTPFVFIPFYEKQEIISLVDFFVLEDVCRYLHSVGEKNLKMSVNFSRITFFEHDIVERVTDICNFYDVPTSQITIEITETIQGFDQNVLLNTIDAFLKAGFALSLDDFGSGYSNMVLIASANFKEVKIDKTLVDEIVNNDKSKVLANLVISACSQFSDTSTVAEGIETNEQYQLLRDMKCEIGQGYYFDRPLSEKEFTEKYVNRN